LRQAQNTVPLVAEDTTLRFTQKSIPFDYTAEIIYAQKIHLVKLETGAHFQEWEIVAFDSDSVSLVERKAKPKKSKTRVKNESSTKKPLKLLVAPTGNSITPYQQPHT
jgi:hypothetical protein